MRDADAVLTIIPEGAQTSPGTTLGLEESTALGKPMFTSMGNEDIPEIISWLRSLPDGIDLCVGGPRASECPHVYDTAIELLSAVLDYYIDIH